MVQMIWDAIAKKAKKQYFANTVLIVYCMLERLPFPAEWEMIIEKLTKSPTTHPFRELTIIDARTNYTATI